MDTLTPEYLTTAQVAQQLGITPRQVLRLTTLQPVMQLTGPTGAKLYRSADVLAEKDRRA